MRFPRFLMAALAVAVAIPEARAQQNPFPFFMQYTEGQITTSLINDSSLTLAAPIGQTRTLVITARYNGTGTVTLTQAPFIDGSSSFSAAINQPLPLTLTNGQSFVFRIQYFSTSATAVTARFTLPFAETPASTITPISFTLQGISSALVLSYRLPEDDNVVQLTSGQTIPFPETRVGGSSNAALGVTNIGALQGTVNKVTITGSAFRLQSLPLFPAGVLGGQTVSMQVVFRPVTTGKATGTLTVDLAGADPITVNLEGSAVAPNLTYQFGSPLAPVEVGGTLTLPGVDVGLASSAIFRVTNTGSASATLTAISVVGSAFTVPTPPALPQTLAPNASVSFAVRFEPDQVGPQTGTLVINTDLFNLTGNGQGAQLNFSYTAAGSVINLSGANNSIIFSPVRVTESAQIPVDIRNVGTTPSTILSIALGQTGTPFTIVNPPALPMTIAPNGSTRLTLRYEPVAIGFATNALVIDNNSFQVTGSGTQPPALPAYTISGPTGSVAPLAQPSAALKLSAPYPVTLAGTLTLAPSVASLPPDPAVQFASGGRTVPFRIPANTLDAVFLTQVGGTALGTQVGLQTGTVAGTMTLTPTFATQAGNIDLTPASPTTAQFSVSPAAPAVLAVQVLNPTATGFTLQVSGFTTTRTLTALNVQFTAASGFKMPTSQFALDIKSIAAAWFQGTASQAFGSQFRLSIPFTFQVPAGQSVLNGITQATVTAANESGTSAPVSARLQ